MILVMDVGNTNIKMGVFDGEKNIKSFRVATDLRKTGDEYGVIVSALLAQKGLSFADIDGVIMSSVSPALNYTLEHMCRYFIGKDPIVMAPGIKTGLSIKYDNARELGSDRIVNAVAAVKKYGGPCIVVDFGTATTFSVVSGKNEFLGGAICPGIKTATDALVENAAKLPRIELEKPPCVIGRSTITNMQSGVIYGFIGLVENIVRMIKKELGDDDVKVIATGGMSQLMQYSDKKTIDVVDRDLTLSGLKIIYDLNKE